MLLLQDVPGESKPRVINFRHSHELHRVRSSGDQIGDSLHNRCRSRVRVVCKCMIPLDFTCHDFCTLDDAFDVSSNVCPEREVERPRLTSTMQPSHNLISSKETELLVQTKIRFRQTPRDSQNTCGKKTLRQYGSQESLHIWSQPEGHCII